MSIMHSALLQRSCSRSLPLSFTLALPCRPIAPSHTPVLVPTCALKYPKRIVDSLAPTFHKMSLVPSTNSRYGVLAFGAYTCTKQGKRSTSFNINTHILSPCGIHSSIQLSKRGLTSIPKAAWTDFDAQRLSRRDLTHCPAQLCGVRSKALSRRDANNMLGISFGLVD